ncbi:hypothetical protein L207DRAFT_537362 [Hyaloscypha variabilis F]|uniref:Uncharacterized protein n=1 Tax=Hyaloscypha variabilis (strain UAMH 11265 / GT02V1 / F) TaxID=1149755 RepID=A0A2J6QXD7_HYAVF|nr:hypothetical protein L207DRAFT_537362 [Hyaloscypha variabilis F]
MNTIEPPPERFSKAWFENKYASWKAQPRSLKWVQVVILSLVFVVIFKWSWKFVWGLFYYYLAYGKAALQYGVSFEPCARVMRETYPWRVLGNEEYFRRMRCEGNDHGSDRQGNLIPTFSGFIGWLFDPYAFSSWERLVLLGLFSAYLLRPLWNGVVRLIVYLINRLVYVWRYQTWVFSLIPVFIAWAFINWFMALLCASAVYYGPWEAVGRVIGGSTASTASTSFGQDVQSLQTDTASTDVKTCVHVKPCTCFDKMRNDMNVLTFELRSTEDDHSNTEILLSNSEQELERVRTQLDNARQLASSANYLYNPLSQGQVPTLGAFVANTQYDQDHLLADFERTRRRVADLEQDKDKLIQEKNNLISKYNAEFVKYKQQLDYNRGAGDNMILAVSEADALKAKVRTLQRENKALIEAGMQTRQALAKEREVHSEKCQDEAGCQMKISALEYKCKQLLDSHAYNDKIVVDAAIKFGMPKEEAVHIDLMSYLHSVTLEVARLKALGVQGLGATNTIDFTVKQLQEELERMSALKNRMEREVDRLGGNVIGIRNGWDTAKPKFWATEMDTTYEENAHRIFPIYERLCQGIIVLEKAFADANEPAPLWAPEVPRNHQTFGEGFVPTPQNILEANKLANRMITGSEELNQKLTINEVQRLYNRALQLAVRMRDLSPKERLPSGELVVQNPLIRNLLQQSDKVFKDVLIQILDDRRPVRATPTERAPDPRLQKKFEIYIGMQEAIQALTNSIVANSHIPPPWIQNLKQQSKPWSSPDNLALNLMNTEMRALEERIKQLLQCMTELKLPGTLYGTPRIDNASDPEYNARWYELVSSTTYAGLVLSHWQLHLDQKQVEIEDEKTGKKKMVTIPVANIMPLTTKDQYFRDALNRGESDKVKAARELKEGKWPHPDTIQATVFDIPGVGPRIEFKYIDPNAKVEEKKANDSKGNKSFKQDENSNPTDSNGNNDYEKAKKHWETKKQRIQQLKNHILSWGIKGNHQLPNVANALKKNMGTEDVKRANNIMDEQIGKMCGVITQAGRQVPKMMHKGGKMYPG